jgi:hypothetical protein
MLRTTGLSSDAGRLRICPADSRRSIEQRAGANVQYSDPHGTPTRME